MRWPSVLEAGAPRAPRRVRSRKGLSLLVRETSIDRHGFTEPLRWQGIWQQVLVTNPPTLDAEFVKTLPCPAGRRPCAGAIITSKNASRRLENGAVST